jgi:V8-like Glu-specific endopeptidase
MQTHLAFEGEPFEFSWEMDGAESELGPARHPTLGPGRRVPRQGEVEEFGTALTAFHPSLGPGRKIGRTAEIETELEIVGVDERQQVGNTKDVPFRWICLLDLLFPDPDDRASYLAFVGSGTLISARHVLTAGHCLYDRIIGSAGTPAVVQVARVRVIPGRNGSQSPFGSVMSTAVRYAANWRSSRNYRSDYGLITVGENIGSKKMPALGGGVLGYWGSSSSGSGTQIVPKERNVLQGASVNISGYPADKPSGTQWRAFGQVTNARPAAGQELIYYNLDTCGGHSGSPVWLRWQQSRNLVAIHTGPCIPGTDCQAVTGAPCFPGGQRYSSNRGILMTTSVLNDVKQWMA